MYQLPRPPETPSMRSGVQRLSLFVIQSTHAIRFRFVSVLQRLSLFVTQSIHAKQSSVIGSCAPVRLGLDCAPGGGRLSLMGSSWRKQHPPAFPAPAHAGELPPYRPPPRAQPAFVNGDVSISPSSVCGLAGMPLPAAPFDYREQYKSNALNQSSIIQQSKI